MPPWGSAARGQRQVAFRVGAWRQGRRVGRVVQRVATGGAFYRARDALLPDYALTVQRAWTLFSSEGLSFLEI